MMKQLLILKPKVPVTANYRRLNMGTFIVIDTFQKDTIFWKTWHFRHVVIFFRQFFWGAPSQNVPLINQHRWPDLNSHAGHFSRISFEHFRKIQHAFCFSLVFCFRERRNRSWRSTYMGMRLHPCSKLCTALEDIPNNWPISFCDFPQLWRILENSFLFIQRNPPRIAFPLC